MAVDGLAAQEWGAVALALPWPWSVALSRFHGPAAPSPWAAGPRYEPEKPGLHPAVPPPRGHPGVPLLINRPAPRDEFVQSHLRKEGDEIESHNYLLKLQLLSRRTELLQTPLAGSQCMGERE